jgi:NTE family protein
METSDATPQEQHVEEDYLPQARRNGVALCLSGGGFRATLFHLGALRRLNELGALSRVDMLTSVSGGSITAAHLATAMTNWPQPGTSFPEWDEKVSTPLRRFTSHNIRTGPLLRWLLVPWNWTSTGIAVDGLARQYERLTHLPLVDISDRPAYTLCATDINYGVAWTFTRSTIGDYRLGLRPTPSGWLLARATAASSCFPPVFDAMDVRVSPTEILFGKEARHAPGDGSEHIRLSDGGVYDNLGLEPVWKQAAIVLVSDGGAVFQFSSNKTIVSRLLRYPDIMGNQVGSLRKRWLIASFVAGQMQGSYWGIGSAASHYRRGATGYAPELVADIICQVRTDLDSFSEAEAAVLENHGYCLAEAAILQHVPDLANSPVPPFQIPHPEWMDEDRVRKALAKSHTRTLLGRGWQRALLNLLGLADA